MGQGGPPPGMGIGGMRPASGMIQRIPIPLLPPPFMMPHDPFIHDDESDDEDEDPFEMIR